MNELKPVIVNRDQRSSRGLVRVSLDSKQFDENWLQQPLFQNPELLPFEAVAPDFGKAG